jgi:hypothetical protein
MKKACMCGGGGGWWGWVSANDPKASACKIQNNWMAFKGMLYVEIF